MSQHKEDEICDNLEYDYEDFTEKKLKKMILNPIGTNLVMQADDDLRHAEEEEDANHSVSRLTMNNLGILDH